ncbi:hypothetical protein [Sulfurovum sp.]|uniref:glycine-rich domain-containing protein n=1 Tax=Sulfurovum sp. TaxID=1969726 RepID=UPI0035670338
MAKINRYTGDLKAFGSGALALERTVFGSVTQSDTLDSNINADFLRGWENGTDINGYPTKQFFNAVGFTATQILAYLHQIGLAEWDILQEYNTDSFTNRNGVIFVSLSDANIGNDPESDAVNWKRSTGNIDSVVVTKILTSGTYEKPDNLISLTVEVTGGGGGGGGADGQGASTVAAAGGGGGGGTSFKSILSSALLSSETVTIGAGGAGGLGNVKGVTGGASSFGIHANGLGGEGGNQSVGTAVLQTITAGQGATGTSGQINKTGGNGERGVILSVDKGASGGGGGTMQGEGPRGERVTVGVLANGADGVSYGSGGAGGAVQGSTADRNGGSGANGVVIITEYLGV